MPIEIITAGWYNFLYLAAILVAAVVMRAEGRRRRWRSTTWSVAILAWVVGGTVGALVPRLFLGDLAAARTCIGAVAGATIALALAARWLRISASGALDSTAIAIPLGGAVVRMGCFLAGCCQGTFTTLPIGVVAHDGELARHPVQVYEAIIEVMIAWTLVRRRSASERPGARFVTSLASLGTMRFALEFVRDNEKLGPLSLAQWILLPIIAIAVAMLVWRMTDFDALLRRLTPAHALIAAGALVAAAVGQLGGLPPLELASLILFLIAGVVIHLRLRRTAPAGLTALALQMPVISADSTFPRIYTSLGAGLFGSSFDYRHIVSSCDSTEEWTRHHSVGGGSLEFGMLRQTRPLRSFGFRARAFTANENASAATDFNYGGPVVNQPVAGYEAYSVRSTGVTLVGDADFAWTGFSLGATLGNFYPVVDATDDDNNHRRAQQAWPAVRVRVGPPTAHLELRVGDELPTGVPLTGATFGVGLGNDRGSRLRFGVSEFGFFAAGRYISPAGLEIDPMLSGGSGNKHGVLGGIMVRKWFRTDPKVRGAPPTPGGR